MLTYENTFNRFIDMVRSVKKDQTMVSLIIDSPWMPGYAGLNTLDFYFDQDVWLKTYLQVIKDLPGVAFLPGSWVEFGMAAEPSGWGATIQWFADSPPAIQHISGGFAGVLEKEIPNPETDGMMAVILRQYERMNPQLQSAGIPARMAAARGPLTIASHLIGVTELLMATQLEPAKATSMLENTTELCIRWLKAQLGRMNDPVGVLVLDDVVGMLSPDDAEKFALPYLRRIFESFPDLIHIYHNDTPNSQMLPGLATIGMDVFNFSHEISIEDVRSQLGPDIVLLGNISPLDILVRGSVKDVRQATRDVLKKVIDCGPIIISPGGGVSPGTPIENLQAMAAVVEAGI